MQKGASKPSLLGVFVWFRFPFFFVFVVPLERGKKVTFLLFWSFFLLFPKKPLFQNPSLLLVCLLLFIFDFPFKILSLFFPFFFIYRFWENIIVFCLLYRSCLSCPSLTFASYLETNFPEIPFSNPSCFHFWLFGSWVVVLSCFVCVYVICFLGCVCCIAFRIWKIYVWCIVGSKVVFSDLCICSCFFCCVVCFFKKWSWNILCVVSFFLKTQGLDCLLVWISLSGSILFCFWSFVFSVFSFLAKDRATKDQTLPKKTKLKMQKHEQECCSVSAVVFTNNIPNSFGVGLNMQSCDDTTVK